MVQFLKQLFALNRIKMYWSCVVALYINNYIRDYILQESEPRIVKFLVWRPVGNFGITEELSKVDSLRYRNI
jgi:hypothetical protein